MLEGKKREFVKMGIVKAMNVTLNQYLSAYYTTLEITKIMHDLTEEEALEITLEALEMKRKAWESQCMEGARQNGRDQVKEAKDAMNGLLSLFDDIANL